MNNQAYQVELLALFMSIPDEKKESFSTRFVSQAYNPTVVFGFSSYLGFLGIDRFILGQVVLGLLKLFTLGGFYIWYIIDLFLVAGEARQKNIDMARQIALTL